LTMGMLFYRSKVNLLTGWIHHSVYVFVVEYAIHTHTSHIFGLCAVMEIPTFVLGLGSIISRLRSDVIFALCFFTTRIVYHIVLAVSLAIQHDAIGGSFVPAIIMAGIFPLHAFWFVGCIKGFLERAKTVEKSVPVTRLPINTISSPERLIVPGVSGPVSS